MGKIKIEESTLLIADDPAIRKDGTTDHVAVAVAAPRPKDHTESYPKTSPCWLAWVLTVKDKKDVKTVRERFARAAGIDPAELTNVIAVVGKDSDELQRAFKEFGVDPRERSARMRGKPIVRSCSIGGRDTIVSLDSASQATTHFKAEWCIVKGQEQGGDCIAEHFKAWLNLTLSESDAEEIHEETTGHQQFPCEGS